jgi:Helix-turn-helix domain of resolvase
VWAIALLVLLVPSVARAEQRLALLIGNEPYAPTIGALANPHNDVAVLATALKGLRKPTLDRARVKGLAKSGLGPAKIARELGMARSSVYRLLEE